ncbi:MAG TPA: hypothetical protein ENJ82_04430 [Bacteroidetes bacterium]|nr:hypothetical protein [Bacteroidota bacterium]
MANSSSHYLHTVLYTYHRNRIPKAQRARYHKVGAEVIRFLQTQTGRTGQPFISGSVAKKTDINEQFDLDIVVPFRYDSLCSIAEIKNRLFQKLKGRYQNTGAFAKKSRIAIMLKFLSGTITIAIGVVPGMELEAGLFDQRKKDEDNNYLHLFEDLADGKGKIVTTNVYRQKRLIREKGNMLRIPIKLLKIWKHTFGFDLSSYVVEVMVVEAFRENPFSGKQTAPRLLAHVLRYMQPRLLQGHDLQDIGANNCMPDYLNSDEKIQLANHFKHILNILKTEDLAALAERFPLNLKYHRENW